MKTMMDGRQWRIQGRACPLVLDQTKAQRAKKTFFWRLGPQPPYLRVWMIQFINFVALGYFISRFL